MQSLSSHCISLVAQTRHSLVGTFPSELLSGRALPDLSTIDLSHNGLHGTLPPIVMGGLDTADPMKISTTQGDYQLQILRNTSLISSFSRDSELQYLDVSFNQLTGSLPPLLQQIKRCRNLYLNHNRFAGPLEALLTDDGVGEGELGKCFFATHTEEKQWSGTSLCKQSNLMSQTIY